MAADASDRILREADVAKASLYSLLGSKDNLVIAYLEQLDEQFRARWGERYTPGRIWHVVHEDGTIQHGHSANVRTAKREAQAALAVGGHDVVDSRWGQ